MKHRQITLVVTAVLSFSFILEAENIMKDYPIKPVEFTRVHFEDGFWRPRLETNTRITLPANFQKSEETGRISNFAKAGKLMEGKHEGIFFNDSDVFKIVEGAAYTLAIQYDSELDQYLDHLIGLFAAAQEEDGYLYTARTIDPENAPAIVGKERWENIRIAHELYNIGHMYEAAVAHYQATGKRTFLDVALKSADLVCRTFGPGKKYATPGHQEIEIGLVKLYRVTGNQDYLDMARFFIEQRGNSENRELFGDYCQDHKPLEQQDDVVGHSVRAGYFYAGAADVAVLTDNTEYKQALQRLWENMVGKKMYVTGGIGALRQGEQFGANYELPNETAYAETCAAISSILWNQRMFLIHGDARYIDVLERALYNGFLPGISLSGDTFFYVNPLASDGLFRFNHGAAARQPWFDCSCCPTNVVRLLPSLPGYVYAVQNDAVYVNLFVAGTAEITLDDTAITLKQETDYPWAGQVSLTVTPPAPKEFELRIRIPGWAQHTPVPSDLYRYLDNDPDKPVLSVNGAPVEYLSDKGYALLRRVWSGGEVITLELPMRARRVLAHEAVEANRGRVAVERGPIVYCAEWADNPGGVYHRFLPDTAAISENRDESTAITTLSAPAKACRMEKGLEEPVVEDAQLTLIPYYYWAHRGEGEMQVWLARTASSAQPLPVPTVTSTARVSASHTWEQDTLAALNDGVEPKASNDHEIARFTWWPRKGSREWVQYEFSEPTTLNGAAVYWFDDAPDGGCRAPAKWELLYADGKSWIPVSNPSGCDTALNQYNEVVFDPVTTTAIRLTVRLQREYSAGILEWKLFEPK